MQHSASSGSISGGYGGYGGYGGNADGFKPTTEGGTPNFGAGVPMAQKGGDSSTTYATLTEGKITLGGKQTTAAELGINTDAIVAHTAIKDLPNAEKLLADQQAMASAMGTVVATSKQLAADIGNQAMVNLERDYAAGLSEEERARFNDLTPSERAQELQSVRYDDYKTAEAQRQSWGIGSANGRALEAVTTLLIGAVSGQSGGQVAANALAPYAAQLIGEKFDTNHGSEPNAAAQALSHALLGAVLAEVNGTSLAGGALAGAGGELAAKYLTEVLDANDPRAIDPVTGQFVPNLLREMTSK
jgi:filamentous hemagglutinin